MGFGVLLAGATRGLRGGRGSSVYPAHPGAVPQGTGLRFALIRPPGALPEPEFLGACIKCSRCQQVCDTGAILYYSEGEGALAHTPYVDPAVAACNLCMRCTQICPSGALRPMTRKQRKEVSMASVTLRKDNCLSYKAKNLRYAQGLLEDLDRSATEVELDTDRQGICGECYMVCPRRGHAIRYEPGRFLAPIVDPGACVGCGLCEEICRVVLRGDPAIRIVPTRFAN